MKNILLISLTLLLMTSGARANCEVAVLLAGNGPKIEMGERLIDKMEAAVLKADRKNKIFQITNPLQANADYLYLITSIYSGFKVSVALIGVRTPFYSNVYAGSTFHSEEQVTEVLAQDFATSILPKMDLCKK